MTGTITRRILLAARDGGYTIAQYAAEFNLNPNTARRYLRAFKEDTVTADSRKPNKPVRKPLKSMIIDHSNDQHSGDHIAAEIAEKQRVNAIVSVAVENAKRQNKRINDRSDDHDVITRAHRTLRDRWNATPRMMMVNALNSKLAIT